MDATNGAPHFDPENSGRPANPVTPDAVPAPTPQADARRHRQNTIAIVSGALAAAVLVGAGASFGIVVGNGVLSSARDFAAAQASAQNSGGSSRAGQLYPGFGGSSSSNGSGSNGSGEGTFGGNGSEGNNSGGGLGGGSLGDGESSGGSDASTLPRATAAEEVGIVDIDTVLSYQGAEAAGTGLVLTSDGEILTNNHVVEGSTSISVTVVATGAKYTASVVGTDATDDVAVLKLSDASGLSTAHIDSTPTVSVGDTVTGVGNAGGTGGTPSASAGQVTGTNQTITTEAEESAASETLNGLIQTNADIEAGDSGGPLFNADNEIVGIDTAAQSGGSDTEGFAIPISTALNIASQIQAGRSSSNITIGYPAFLGVEVGSSDANGFSDEPATQAGASVSGVVDGTPAADLGLAEGDTITSVNGSTVSSSSDLTAALATHKPGQSVTIGWVDASGASHTASVTLANGPVA